MTETVTLTEVQAPSFISGFQSNCISLVTEAPFLLTNGTFVATWTATTPLTSRLDLVFTNLWVSANETRSPGTSPITMELPRVTIGPDRGTDLWLASINTPRDAAAAAAVEQKVTLSLAFEYWGTSDITGRVSGCALG